MPPAEGVARRRQGRRGPRSATIAEISPRWLSPGLLGNELLRRNLPVALSEYAQGEPIITVRNGVTYSEQTTTNPRTGEDITALLHADPVSTFAAGYRDVDRDGVTDCLDAAITPTGDNVDGDFVPDRIDPDLRIKHDPYLWAAGSPL